MDPLIISLTIFREGSVMSTRAQKNIAAMVLARVFLGASGSASGDNDSRNNDIGSVNATVIAGGEGNTATANMGEMVSPRSGGSVTTTSPGGSGGSGSCSYIYKAGYYPTVATLRDIDLDKSCPQPFKTHTGDTAYEILPFPCPCR